MFTYSGVNRHHQIKLNLRSNEINILGFLFVALGVAGFSLISIEGLFIGLERVIFACFSSIMLMSGTAIVFSKADLILDRQSRQIIKQNSFYITVYRQVIPLDKYNSISLSEVVDPKIPTIRYVIHLMSDWDGVHKICLDSNLDYAKSLERINFLSLFLGFPFENHTIYNTKSQSQEAWLKLPSGSRIQHRVTNESILISLPDIGVQTVNSFYLFCLVCWPFAVALLLKPLLVYPQMVVISAFIIFGLFPVVNLFLLLIKTATSKTNIYVHGDSIEINQNWALQSKNIRLLKSSVKKIIIAEKKICSADNVISPENVLKIVCDKKTIICGIGLDTDELRWVKGMINAELSLYLNT